jgi:hypothetical protein
MTSHPLYDLASAIRFPTGKQGRPNRSIFKPDGENDELILWLDACLFDQSMLKP